ncbi:MAG: universal stress protein [Coriobacteriia bacterium]|nr:universal stress protein [Coriobacteriia bacterium]
MSISSMLVPVGLDARDEKVLRYVCGLSVQSVQKVLIVTAVDSSGLEAPVVAAEVDRARERLAAMAASAMAGCSMQVEMRVVTGDRIECILALAEQADIDVICCGTSGKSVVDALFAGSVSERLFASGKVRTMTVRYDLLESVDDPLMLSHDFAKRLVVPTDFSAAATRAWLSAVERPADAIDYVTALHVLSPDASEEDARNAEVMMRGLLAIAEGHGVEARTEIRVGEPAEVVLAYLAESGATGCITGQYGRGALRQVMLGGLSLELLREAPCPVVVQP